MSFVEAIYGIYQALYLKPRTKILLFSNRERLRKEYPNEFNFLMKQIDTIPYKLKVKSVEIGRDENGDIYGVYAGERLYLAKDASFKYAKELLRTLIREQLPLSPHCYTDEKFNVDENSILIDCGSAEGNFTLQNIEKCKHCYLIEPEANRYNDALRKTFSKYWDKITIVNSYISETTDKEKNIISLDDLFSELHDENIFLKMDLEGFGLSALKGAKKLLTNNHFKIAFACYHYPDEDKVVEQFLCQEFPECEIQYTDGYMFLWFAHDLKYPFFRKGMLRAKDKR